MPTPQTQHAIQFVGADQIVHNTAKVVVPLRDHEVRVRIDSCGVCFSDTKLLHAFDAHLRKAFVVGVDDAVIAQLTASAQYVPGTAPGVPGHEVSGRIVEIGSEVRCHSVGERVLVQTDYRHLPTPGSNAAFGYNFEGGLQQYVTVDERVVIEPGTGERFLIPVSETPTCSAVSLCEPWACVEAAYAWSERQAIRPGGAVLVVAEVGRSDAELEALLAAAAPQRLDREIGDGPYDDIIYLGSDADTLERLTGLLGFGGLLVFALGGESLPRPVQIDVGRVHYDLIRVAGTSGSSVAEAYARIPAVSEVRAGDRVAVIGAAGPMGLMHTLRTAVSGVPDVSIEAVDVDDTRLAHLAEALAPIAAANGVPISFRNTANQPLDGRFDYVSVMVPSPGLISQAVDLCDVNAIVNAFAGFAVGTTATIDLNVVAERGVYLIGTSGSRMQDMKTVLARVESGVLDTNVSLDAICGMAGVADAFEAIQNRTVTGKIMVYPSVVGLGLVRLADLASVRPDVAAAMDGNRWTSAAEMVLLEARSER